MLDILTGSPKDILSAQSALLAAKKAGETIICAVAYAEIAAQFKSRDRADDFFALLCCRVESIEQDSGFSLDGFSINIRSAEASAPAFSLTS